MCVRNLCFMLCFQVCFQNRIRAWQAHKLGYCVNKTSITFNFVTSLLFEDDSIISREHRFAMFTRTGEINNCSIILLLLLLGIQHTANHVQVFGSSVVEYRQSSCLPMDQPILLSPSAERAVCSLESLGRAAGMLSKTDAATVGATCEAAKDMLLSRAKHMVATSHGFPLLSSKSCDGTPIRCQHYASSKLPSDKTVRHRGKQGLEILVSNQFIRYQDPGSGWQTVCLLSEPVPLTAGKDVPRILAAAQKTWHSLRSLGAQGCVVEHYCWDRAGLTALERQCRRWHLSQPVPDTVPYKKGIREYLEFVVITPCALHDSQNAFRWAFFEDCKDRALMRDLYISVESLRNSADILSSRLASFIAEHLVFVDENGAEWKELRRELWMGLDVEPEVADILVELELTWDGHSFSIAAGAQVVGMGKQFAYRSTAPQFVVVIQK